MKQPAQPMYRDHLGVVRFKPNKIIEYLFEKRLLDLNAIAMMDFPQEDRIQIAQLLGYSVSGFGDLSYVPRSLAGRMDAEAEQVSNRRAKPPQEKARP